MKRIILVLLALSVTAGAAWSQADRLELFGYFRLKPLTFTTLPLACSGSTVGALATVSDSNTVTWGATIAGGSSNNVLAWCNGTNWTVAGK